MIITIVRSGGVTGIPMQKTIDTSDLPSPKAKKVQSLIEKTDFFSLVSQSANSPDRFQYTITIQHDQNEHTVTFSEDNLPQTLAPLMKKF